MRLAASLTAIGILASALPALAQQTVPLNQEVVLSEQSVITYRPVQKRVVAPIKEYHAETRVSNWWNPFKQPHYTVHYVPSLRWEERMETSYIPQTHKQYIAETRVSQAAPQPLVLAQRPVKPVAIPAHVASQPVALPVRMQDSLPMVPVVATRPATTYRQAQIHEPHSTLVPSQPSTTLQPRGGLQRYDDELPRSGIMR